jgi:hypothetical protein
MALRIASSALILALLCACGGTENVSQALAACARDRSAAHHLEVYVARARVVSVLGTRTTERGTHEGFLVDAGGRMLRVETNTNLTGYIPLRAGVPVSLLGQLECDDDVIHWTHRDPRGRHISGYVEVDGRRYQ